MCRVFKDLSSYHFRKTPLNITVETKLVENKGGICWQKGVATLRKIFNLVKTQVKQAGFEPGKIAPCKNSTFADRCTNCDISHRDNSDQELISCLHDQFTIRHVHVGDSLYFYTLFKKPTFKC